MIENTAESIASGGEALDSTISPGSDAKKPGVRREIKGGLPYTAAPGVFKRALEGIIAAERPDKFSGHFMSTILKVSGGSAKPIPPLLKKMRFISSDGSPTDLYSKFKSDSARSNAAYEGLRSAFGEMFRRNDFIHKADENKVTDLIVEITGLKRNDPIIRYTQQTFEAIRSFIDRNAAIQSSDTPTENESGRNDASEPHDAGKLRKVGLTYNINIVLPETENVSVFNAIFRSLKNNLLS